MNQLLAKKSPSISLISTAASPILGVEHCMTSNNDANRILIEKDFAEGLENSNTISHQKFCPDRTTNPHPRMIGLLTCMAERTGSWDMNMQIPRYQDVNTDMTSATERDPVPGKIYCDSPFFGPGMSSLQLTYESQNIDHARYLYDMLLPFTPIMSALSASSPILKGQLTDTDFRWELIQKALDDRTEAEKNPNSEEYMAKSRWSGANQYISNHEYVMDFHNDSPL